MANKSKMTFDVVRKAISGSAAAFRCRTTLQPAGGEGDKVFPPTYAGAVYAIEERRVPGNDEPVTSVLLDSVQSQANRMEEALQFAVDRGRIQIPVISVEFSSEALLDEIRRVSSLEAPHRVADAILRDSEIEGIPFRQSELGKRVDNVSLQNASPLFDLCPTALVFGMWDSTGPKGGLGAKFQRAIVSEIVGIGAQIGKKTSSRIDPLQIRAAVKVVKTKGGEYTVDEKAKGAVSPAEVNHGNIPPDISEGGVTIKRAEQTTVLSLPALRRLRFPLGDGPSEPKVHDSARTALAALALCGAALAAERGFDLRSRCLLWPTEPMTWEILDKPGEQPQTFELDADTAILILNEAIDAATKAGLPWRTKALVLTPSKKLFTLVQKSQQLAAAEAPREEGE